MRTRATNDYEDDDEGNDLSGNDDDDNGDEGATIDDYGDDNGESHQYGHRDGDEDGGEDENEGSDEDEEEEKVDFFAVEIGAVASSVLANCHGSSKQRFMRPNGFGGGMIPHPTSVLLVIVHAMKSGTQLTRVSQAVQH